MVRRIEAHQLCFQLVTTTRCNPKIVIAGYSAQQHDIELQLGERCVLYILRLVPTKQLFPVDVKLRYELLIDDERVDLNLLAYDNDSPELVIPNRLEEVLHGSCRNPHHESRDSLSTADQYVETARQRGDLGPQLLMMSGDQIYADDVAGPMLLAITQLSALLGLYPDKHAMLALPVSIQEQLYHRPDFLPKTPWQNRSKLCIGYWFQKDEPHFTSMKAGNHLISLSEFIALYLLTWSSEAWQLIDFSKLNYIGSNAKHAVHFNHELTWIKRYVDDLPRAERIFANVSTLMMFDDHDVTDDWNLTAKWEQAVYQTPQSARIINNGMTAYWLFQGLGNDAGETTNQLTLNFVEALKDQHWDWKSFSKPLQRFNSWHYCLNTTPKVVVLDTRTHRWRNDDNFNEPSGLMDWDRLLELEQNLVSHDQVILVSPAPVFGVKAIEAIQALFNACGEPLLVDVENWMAHEGAAKKLLDIFRRPDTPSETIILSGDVHYSFCFSVKARFGKHDNRIWQLTASGIKNEFPKKLIKVLDKLDSWLYAPYSPLNLFTKRWQMNVGKHPIVGSKKTYLVSDSSISLVSLHNGTLEKYQLLHGNGGWSQFDLEE
ncbi:alkaline phosphatase D family protein [Pseudoalteromonas xiamenensis]